MRNLNADFTLGNCLVGSVKLTKNADLDKYKYSGYGVEFNSRSEYFLPMDIDNKGKDILILGEGPTHGLDDATLPAEAIYPINFTQPYKIFVLSLAL